MGGPEGRERRKGSERGEGAGGHRNSVSGVTAMNLRLQPAAGDRRFGPERERVGSGERGERGPPPCAACSVLFVVKRTHPRAPTHTYSALRTHLFTLNSAENRRTRVPPPGALRRQVSVTPPVPNPGGPRPRPRATSICREPFTTLPAHDADATLHRAPALPAHTRTMTL